MEIKKDNTKKIMLLITFTVFLYVGLQHLDVVLDVIGAFLSLILPFAVGGGIAFVLNVAMNFFEKHIFGCKKLKNNKIAVKLARPVSLILSILIWVAVIWVVATVVMPELGKTLMGLGKGIEDGIVNLQNWVDRTFKQDSQIKALTDSIDIDPQKMLDSIMSVLKNGVNNFVTSTISVTVHIASMAMNVGIGFVFACYILLQKEKLMLQSKKALYALFPKKAVEYILHVCTLANYTFSHFVMGQCIEAVILGTMFFVTLSILRYPYAMLIGVLIAFTALIPMFGAWIGCIIGFLLILLVSPTKAVIFIVIFNVLQQIEGNFIYPHVVGNSVGLPSIWVLVAVTIGGSLMGIVGMLVFIPLTSVVYALFREWMYKRLNKKQIKVE